MKHAPEGGLHQIETCSGPYNGECAGKTTGVIHHRHADTTFCARGYVDQDGNTNALSIDGGATNRIEPIKAALRLMRGPGFST